MSETTLPPPPGSGEMVPARESGYVKFRNEILAGGASDAPDDAGAPADDTSVIGLVGVIGLLAALAWWRPWIFLFVILLLFCVFLHEVGHFVTARRTGMKVTQFYLFMGPKLWSFRRGETEYGIRLYPVGAFVRIIGMNNLDEVDPGDEPRAYRNQSYPKRMLVICAGSIMHMLIAIALLFGVYAIKGTRVETGEVAIVEVVAGSPAEAAGIRADDIVRSVDGVSVSSADEFVTEIQRHQPADVVPVVIIRDGVESTLQVGLGSNPTDGPAFGKAYIGTRSGGIVDWQPMSMVSAAGHSITDLGTAAWQSVGGVVKVLNPVNIFQHLSGANDDPATQPTTVIGVSRYSDIVGADTGVGGVLLMLAGVNVFVGLLNLFPLLPFDGGHAAIATYERLRSRKGQAPYRADVGKMIPVAMTMMGLLAFLMMAGLYLDIVKPIK